VGIKYARNARSSFKKLFEKVKANMAADGSDHDSDAADEPSKGKKVTPAKNITPAKPTGVTKKSPKPPVAKKATAPRAKAPRKSKKNIKEEVSDDNEGSTNSYMEDKEEEAGKFSINTFTPVNGKKTSRGLEVNTPTTGYLASISGNEHDTADADERDAQLRGMSVEQWRAWKHANDYNNYRSHAPTPTGYLSEEGA
jgi:hypothetical protein